MDIGAGAGLGGELKTVPEDFIVTELLQDGREVMLEDPDGAGEDAVADEEEDEWEARCTSGSDRIFTFCSLLSVTHIGERSCSPAAGRGAEPSLPGTGQVLLCASLSAQLVAVRHRAVAALRAM